MAGKHKLNKQQIAMVKVMADKGDSVLSIAEFVKVDYKTIKAYLTKYDVMNDAEVQGMVKALKEKELEDLYILNAKARQRLHELLDEGKTKMIETIALMDRSFRKGDYWKVIARTYLI